MRGDQMAMFIKYFLPEVNRAFRLVDFLEVPRRSAATAGDHGPVEPSSTRQLAPLIKLAFILRASAHPQ